MRTSLSFLAATLVLLAGPAAHAFTVESVDPASARAALMADPDEKFSSHDDGNGTVTSRYTNGDSTFSFGSTFQSSHRPGYQGSPLLPWEPTPWTPTRPDSRQ